VPFPRPCSAARAGFIGSTGSTGSIGTHYIMNFSDKKFNRPHPCGSHAARLGLPELRSLVSFQQKRLVWGIGHFKLFFVVVGINSKLLYFTAIRYRALLSRLLRVVMINPIYIPT
jgi:hypothetical protein